MNRPRFDRIGWVAVSSACCLLGSFVPAAAQRSGDDTIQQVTLTTKDGVELGATYYRSKIGQEAVPVVILHDYKESRTEFNSLAKALQEGEDSHAVLTVDLRGHGESLSADDGRGRTRELEASRLKTRDFRDMVRFDMEAIRKFLVKKNDERQLNLNKLCLLGSGLGANVAISYAEYDWSVPLLPRRKQGQDVKALILASPRLNSHGLAVVQPLKHPDVREKISVCLAYGKQNKKAAKDVKSIFKLLEKYHPKPTRNQKREERDLRVFHLNTELQGTKLLVNRDFGLLPNIDAFLKDRLTEQDYDWVARRSSN